MQKAFGFFEIYGVFARTKGEGFEPLQTFSGEGGRGSTFADSLWTAPYTFYHMVEEKILR